MYKCSFSAFTFSYAFIYFDFSDTLVEPELLQLRTTFSMLLAQLQEATSFISENVQKLLKAENVALYPVSARSALESKVLASYESAK